MQVLTTVVNIIMYKAVKRCRQCLYIRQWTIHYLNIDDNYNTRKVSENHILTDVLLF